MKPPRTRYAVAGELNIAYQVFGQGPVDLVLVPGFVSHLDLTWEEPTRAAVFHRLGEFARVVVFDKRNTGLSDRTLAAPTLEERMDDIRAVMDAAGVERAAVMGYSEGGPLAILFAATYPDRVTGLVLVSTFSQIQAPPELDQLLDVAEQLWGSGDVLPFFAGTADRDWAARYERSASTPRNAVELLRLNVAMDVTAALPAISAPTLVIHRTGDPLVPVASARAMAGSITGAKLVEFPGYTHLAPDDAAWAAEIDEVEQFLTGTRRTAPRDRVLATVMFTDVVDSTQHIRLLGDELWRQRLEHLHMDAERLISQYRGRLVKDTGDGTLATFDGPARAIRCAAAVIERAHVLGLEMRAGLHSGEVEVIGEDIAGIAVHQAKRVEGAARPGRVWVSQTVHDLVVGSGLDFADAGLHDLKGFAERRRLYELRPEH